MRLNQWLQWVWFGAGILFAVTGSTEASLGCFIMRHLLVIEDKLDTFE